MATKEQLAEIVGEKNVLDNPETLKDYSEDYSFVPPRKPRYVVRPRTPQDVQDIVSWANKSMTPLVPVSSGPPHFRGDTVPTTGGAVIVDLSGMKRVIRVERRNRVAMFQPGLTFTELIPKLRKEGLGLYMPLVPRGTKSVVSSYLEREPIIMSRHHWDIQDPLLCVEVVFGTGDVFVTGSAAGPGTIEEQWKVGRAQVRGMGPAQTDLQRVVQAAQGTMGIVTWASVKCRVLPQAERAFIIPSENLQPLVDFTYRLLRLGLGDVCLIMNNHNLASILASDSGSIVALRESLPHWLLVFNIEGTGVCPEDKVEYQEGDFRNSAQLFGLEPADVVAGVTAEHVSQVLSRPSGEPYWKLKFKGDSRDIFFLTTLDRTPDLIRAMHTLTQSSRYPATDIGVYLQPTMQGCSCHCEFSLSFDPANAKEVGRIKRLVTDGSEALANMGGFFSRPYGSWADFAYRGDAESTAALRKVKGIFDPNDIMNPGKLCF